MGLPQQSKITLSDTIFSARRRTAVRSGCCSCNIGATSPLRPRPSSPRLCFRFAPFGSSLIPRSLSQFLEQRPHDVLQFTKGTQVVLEPAVELEHFLGREP